MTGISIIGPKLSTFGISEYHIMSHQYLVYVSAMRLPNATTFKTLVIQI